MRLSGGPYIFMFYIVKNGMSFLGMLGNKDFKGFLWREVPLIGLRRGLLSPTDKTVLKTLLLLRLLCPKSLFGCTRTSQSQQ